ncbi:MAG: hypothetical protein PHG71_10175, partial [Kiritimatiellae bacterium]|nr:hypothetical protein [Kiritimatiellia bacterium]
MRMTNGRITARLAPGVELILFGPFELEIDGPKEAKLLSGRLVADIPAKDGGFTLRTPDLEMWDYGAVFCASATDEGSDIFVFAGEAQVVEACGEPVDICRAGEGARARRGCGGAVKVEAEAWPYAATMLARVEDKGADKDPEYALYTASRVSDEWAARRMPKVVEPSRPVPGLRGGTRDPGPKTQEAIASRQSLIANRQSASGVLRPESRKTTFTNGGAVPAAKTQTAALAPRKEEEEMKATAKTVAAVTAAALMGAGSARAVPEVSNVVMTQLENTRTVQVTYDLAGENAIVTLSIETNGVAIPDSAVTRLSGDVCKVVGVGTGKSIIWNAGADWPENVTESAKARVTAWSVDAPPQVMVIDLTPGPTAATYPVYYYISMEALPHGGLTNSVYKNTRLVMRKLLAGAFAMGEGTPVEVTLTNDFYAGVFPVTQGQWFNVMGSGRTAYFTDASSRAFRPMEQVSYFDIRGSNTGAGWPTNDAVDAGTFIGNLRVKTGNVNGFD